MGWFEDLMYRAEPFAATGAAFIAGGPQGAALAANHYVNKREKLKHDKQQRSERDNYYVNMRNAAQKANFNPLTVLRSGGGMGYQYAGTKQFQSSSTLGNLFNLMGGDYQRQVRRENLEIASLEAEINLANLRAQDLLKIATSKNSSESNGLLDIAKVLKNSVKYPNDVHSAINKSRIDALAKSQTPPAVRGFGMDWVGSSRFGNWESFEASFGDGWVTEVLGLPIKIASVVDTVGHSLGVHDWANPPTPPMLEGVPKLPKSTFGIEFFNIFNAYPQGKSSHSGVYAPYITSR